MAESRGRRNIELKARIEDMTTAESVAKRVATADGGMLAQVDTYFGCDSGRMKLREIQGKGAELIWYVRSDEAAARASDYRIVEVGDANAMRALMEAAFRVRAVVKKRRRLFFYENVRIHLDDVEGLGTFLEFEAVLDVDGDPDDGEAAERTARERLDWLRNQFGIDNADLMEDSYGDRTCG